MTSILSFRLELESSGLSESPRDFVPRAAPRRRATRLNRDSNRRRQSRAFCFPISGGGGGNVSLFPVLLLHHPYVIVRDVRNLRISRKVRELIRKL